jgi:hypothetical protein
MWFHNQPVALPVRNAQRNGLAIIHQDLGLVELTFPPPAGHMVMQLVDG